MLLLCREREFWTQYCSILKCTECGRSMSTKSTDK